MVNKNLTDNINGDRCVYGPLAVARDTVVLSLIVGGDPVKMQSSIHVANMSGKVFRGDAVPLPTNYGGRRALCFTMDPRHAVQL